MKSCLKFIWNEIAVAVGCLPPACCTYLPASTALGGVSSGGCLLPGVVWSWRVSAAGGGVCSQGGLVLGGLGGLLLGRSGPGGVSAPRRGFGPGRFDPWGVCYPSMQWARPPSLCTEYLTHATENITLPQLRCERLKKRRFCFSVWEFL